MRALTSVLPPLANVPAVDWARMEEEKRQA
jgi:hypothetical protein